MKDIRAINLLNLILPLSKQEFIGEALGLPREIFGFSQCGIIQVKCVQVHVIFGSIYSVSN